MKISTFQILSWDFDIQHILMIINIFVLFLSVLSPVSLMYLSIYQIIFGFYQLVVSGNVLLLSKSLSEQIKFFRYTYTTSAWVYVGVLLIFQGYFLNEWVQTIAFFVIPQIFLGLYYLLTRQELKSRKRYFEMRPMVFVK